MSIYFDEHICTNMKNMEAEQYCRHCSKSAIERLTVSLMCFIAFSKIISISLFRKTDKTFASWNQFYKKDDVCFHHPVISMIFR